MPSPARELSRPRAPPGRPAPIATRRSSPCAGPALPRSRGPTRGATRRRGPAARAGTGHRTRCDAVTAAGPHTGTRPASTARRRLPPNGRAHPHGDPRAPQGGDARRTAAPGTETLRGRVPRERTPGSPRGAGTPRGAAGGAGYSTVTDLARLRGWSTSWPRAAAISQASTCSGTVVTSGASRVGVRGTLDQVVGVRADRLVALLGDHDGAGAAGPYLLDVRDDLVVQHAAAGRRRDHAHHRGALVDQRDRAVLELAGGEALGVHVGELLELERALQRHRVAHVPADEQHRSRRRPGRGPARAPAPCWLEHLLDRCRASPAAGRRPRRPRRRT